MVVGSDGFASEIARLGRAMGWDVIMNSAFDADWCDTWTAVAFATHQLDHSGSGILGALRSNAHYVGVMGSRRRLPALRDRLSGMISAGEMGKLRAPIGLPIRSRGPTEIALSVIAEIVQARRAGATSPSQDEQSKP
jgi:xanthine dehydrogenase accessory factor